MSQKNIEAPNYRIAEIPHRGKRVSIIIAAYNEEKRIGECLASLQKQDYSSFEILLADDGSTDSTLSIVNQSRGVEVIKNNHVGTATSRNAAVKRARGEILVFVDADMTFEPNFISKLVTPINKGETKGTFSKLEYVKNWEEPLARLWNWVNNPDLPDKLRVSQKGNLGEDFRALLKSEFDRVQGFDDTGYTDTWSLASKLGYKPTNAPGAIYYHYNPCLYGEVFSQAAWIGRRPYKFGVLGSMIALVRSFFVLSIIKGAFLTLKKKEIQAIPFHVVYDAGIWYGVITNTLFGVKIK